MTMVENTPNFYILLELNPSEDWDENKFRQVLKAKQQQWSRQSMGMGKNVLIAKRNLELIAEIESVMNDPVQRDRQAQVAKDAQGAKTQARLVEFEQQLQGAEQKGYLEEAELTALISSFKDVLIEGDILRQVSVQVRSPEDREVSQEGQPLLDASILEDISDKLLLVHMSSLYQLLRLPPTASRDELCRAAEQVFDEMIDRQPKTAEVAAQTSLAGHAKNIFGTEEKRRYYDEYLRNRSTNVLFEASDSSDRPTVSQAESTPNVAKQADHEQARVPQRPTVDGAIQQRGGEIRELQAQNIGTALRLTWLWPPNCYEACIYYNNQEWPEPSRNIGSRIRVTRAEYEGGGHYDLHGAMDQTYYIVVAAVLRHGGKQMMTLGVRTEGYLTPQISLRYEIKNPRFWHKQRTLHLYTDTSCSIPTLVLRSKRNTLPLTKEDGEEFYREVGPILVSTKKVIPLPDTSFPPDTYARLFLEDDNLYSMVTILHPHPHERKLRLG